MDKYIFKMTAANERNLPKALGIGAFI